MQKSAKLLNILGIGFLVLVIFVTGFWFGYKNAKASIKEKEEVTISNNPAIKQSSIEVKALDVEGAYWIKAGQQPVCPENYSIKGTFSDNSGSYYTKDNPRFDRIKPDICFASEEFARDKAGFIKKF